MNGGDLVSIHNKETNDFLYPLPRTSPDHHYFAWIGARRADEHSDWRWSDGSSWDYSNWGTGKPTNLRTDDYGGINGGEEYVETKALGFWDNTDNRDDDRGAPFICQQEKRSTPTGNPLTFNNNLKRMLYMGQTIALHCLCTQCPAGVAAVYRTAALPVLAGLADVERVTTQSSNASGALCAVLALFSIGSESDDTNTI